MVESKWLSFWEQPPTGKTKIFKVTNKENGSFLGMIKWYGAWRTYCFFVQDATIFEPTCLKDIASFIENLMLQRKALKQQEDQNKK